MINELMTSCQIRRSGAMTYRVTPRGMQDTVGLISDPVLDNAREDEIDDESDSCEYRRKERRGEGRDEPGTGIGR